MPTIRARHLQKHAERFWSNVRRAADNECWIWTGSVHEQYGAFHLNGDRFGAHKVAVALTTGRYPSKLIVLHSCDNKLCCNPTHLSLGGHSRNQRERAARCTLPRPRVGAELAAEIREYRKDHRLTEVYAKYPAITPQYLRMIIAGTRPRTAGALQGREISGSGETGDHQNNLRNPTQ